MRLNSTYMGTISITPDAPVVAGEFSTWIITFNAGEYGIDDGGTLVIAWKSVSDWDTPQFDQAQEPGFTTVKTNGNCQVKGRYAKFVRSFGNNAVVKYSDILKQGFAKDMGGLNLRKNNH